jgi:hypothetical protein
MNSWMKRWIPVLSLVVVPIAQAQSTSAVDTARQATADTTRGAVKAPQEEQQIQELQKEVDAVRSEFDAARAEGNERTFDESNSHELWP